MQYSRIVRIATFGAIMAAAVPLAAQSGGKGPGPRHPHGGRMLAGLHLTEAQQARVKAIHEKYAGQLTAARETAKPDFEAARAARQRGDTAAARAAFMKARQAMQASKPVREREMAEIRNVLTPEQRQMLDAKKAQWKEQRKEGMRQGPRGFRMNKS